MRSGMVLPGSMVKTCLGASLPCPLSALYSWGDSGYQDAEVTVRPHLTPTDPAKWGSFETGKCLVRTARTRGICFMAYFTPARAVACLTATSVVALMISSALAQTPPA